MSGLLAQLQDIIVPHACIGTFYCLDSVGGRVLSMLDLQSSGRVIDSWPLPVECNPEQVVITKQYNLVSANGRWHLVAEKVTVGLASHRPRVTDISGSSPTEREMSTTYTPVVEYVKLYLYIYSKNTPYQL